ncbi:hypothetical protein CPB84DRAFT_1750930 [Gymnopilus junonius]|uniref:Uncharacterized protein n=1 Tax=Gymnopilus junonius TaxID=109634 RepID=A0A9P5THP1_GYMJU|nr:hypothetical protein CPB84DRAFT_1750930 [Gymnopilus junonius]
MSVQIFVDDTDPGIKYGGGWKQLTFDASNASQFTSSPLYDTAHLATFASSSSANFSYTFDASFLSTALTETITSCTIDGRNATVYSSGQVICQSTIDLRDGTHELVVEATVGILTFWASYSMGVYGTFNNTETSFSEIAASYTLDGEEPINFIIQNTEVDAHYFGTQALILQLPKNPLGQHHLQVNFPDIHEPTPLRFEQIIVQNTTSRTLPPFPTPLTGVLTHGSPGVTNLGTSIGWLQKRITLLKEIGNSELAARPFLLPRILRIEAAKRRGHPSNFFPETRTYQSTRTNKMTGAGNRTARTTTRLSFSATNTILFRYRLFWNPQPPSSIFKKSLRQGRDGDRKWIGRVEGRAIYARSPGIAHFVVHLIAEFKVPKFVKIALGREETGGGVRILTKSMWYESVPYALIPQSTDNRNATGRQSFMVLSIDKRLERERRGTTNFHPLLPSFLPSFLYLPTLLRPSKVQSTNLSRRLGGVTYHEVEESMSSRHSRRTVVVHGHYLLQLGWVNVSKYAIILSQGMETMRETYARG